MSSNKKSSKPQASEKQQQSQEAKQKEANKLSLLLNAVKQAEVGL